MYALNERKVIFIGGTSYSGSTFLDMVLANSSDAFSCGEIAAYFYPYKKQHIHPECGCGDPACGLWEKVRQAGVSNIYQTIFDIYPEVKIIVDSSKNPLWIKKRSEEVKKLGIDVKNVLIWKSPEKFFESRLKRRREKGWQRAWVNYHRYYFSFVESWLSVPYQELIKNPDALERICSRIGIPYFKDKEQYWNKKHHTLFGNTSAKIHLYDEESKRFHRYKSELNAINNNIKKIAQEKGLEDSSVKLLPITNKIVSVLEKAYLSGKEVTDKDIESELQQLRAGLLLKTFYLSKMLIHVSRGKLLIANKLYS